MYGIVVEVTFSAVHHVRLPSGTVEPVHGHDWLVRAHFARESLDELGMVVDFDAAGGALRSIAADYHHGDLNDHVDFSGVDPTAEVVAKAVFDRLSAADLPAPLRVEVTEAPGCLAWYAP